MVECFLVGEDGYLEVELGAGGHFLVLGFSSPRVRQNEYEDFAPEVIFASDGVTWSSEIEIPWNMVPRRVSAVNAFVIAGGKYLCHTPLPGPQPDFHQPARFPAARIAVDPRDDAAQAFSMFDLPPATDIEQARGGLINQTWRVATSLGPFCLQLLHDVVPDDAVNDMEVVTQALRKHGVEAPRSARTQDGHLLARASGGRWRAYTWIPGQTFGQVTGPQMAKRAALLVGRMHRSLAHLRYQPTGSIPGFHDTARILVRLQEVRHHLTGEAACVADDILATLPALILGDEAGPKTIIHGDLKISNIVFDDQDDAIAVIDFDTVLLHYPAIDLGDALRSWCNRSAEDDPEAVFDVEIFEAVMDGYCQGLMDVGRAREKGAHAPGDAPDSP